jgi:tetratricopeptide (TPR) repeat protein
MTNEAAASDRSEKSTSRFKQVLLCLGVVCCLQFLIFGVVGVVRGVSVQSWVPIWILIAGLVLLMPFSARHRWASFLSSFCLIVYALVAINQGKYQKQGEELYDTGKYEEAMVEFRREIDTWYLRLQFNHKEAASLYRIAECQSQLEQFAEARETYREVEENYRGFYKDRAKVAGNTMEGTLVEIEDLEKALAEASDDKDRAMVHFDLALAYRELICTKKAIAQYEMIQALEAPEPLKESAKRLADKLL